MDLPRRTNIPRQSKSFAGKRRRRVVWVSILSIFCVAIVLFVASQLFSLSTFKVTNVQVFGVTDATQPLVKEAVEKSLQGSYFSLFSRANTFIYSKDAVIAAVRTADPRTESVLIRRDGLHTLNISVSQKAPAALICASLPDWDDTTFSMGDSNSCYFADATGFIFDKTTALSGHVYNAYFMPDRTLATSSNTLVGTQATTTEMFRALQSFYGGVREAGMVVEGLLIQDNGTYELYIKNQDNDDIIVVHFNSSISLQEALSNLVAFWSHAQSTARTTKKPLHLSDIQLQFPPNVYYTEVK